MTMDDLYISRFSTWAPGIESPAEWNEWALGRRNIASCTKGPEISFTDSMFRRRLSQISKMTIQVIHDLLPLSENTKILFLSLRGELSRQYQINKMLIEEKALMPAAFSLSVFNAPVALASIALGLKGGYTAIYPPENNLFGKTFFPGFDAGLAAAQAALLADMASHGQNAEIVLVYADEEIPPEYSCFFRECPAPLAFALLISAGQHTHQHTHQYTHQDTHQDTHQKYAEEGHLSVPLSSLNANFASPFDFLKGLLTGGSMHEAS